MVKIYLDDSVSKTEKPPLEDTDLMNFIAWFDFNYPHLSFLMIHVPNESDMPVQGRVKAKRKGVRSGVPDLLFLKQPRGLSGLAIEMKRATKKHSSPVSSEQAMYLQELSEENFNSVVAYGLEQAKKATIEYLQYKQT